jgi:hypothetical protein
VTGGPLFAEVYAELRRIAAARLAAAAGVGDRVSAGPGPAVAAEV